MDIAILEITKKTDINTEIESLERSRHRRVTSVTLAIKEQPVPIEEGEIGRIAEKSHRGVIRYSISFTKRHTRASGRGSDTRDRILDEDTSHYGGVITIDCFDKLFGRCGVERAKEGVYCRRASGVPRPGTCLEKARQPLEPERGIFAVWASATVYHLDLMLHR